MRHFVSEVEHEKIFENGSNSRFRHAVHLLCEGRSDEEARVRSSSLDVAMSHPACLAAFDSNSISSIFQRFRLLQFFKLLICIEDLASRRMFQSFQQ